MRVVKRINNGKVAIAEFMGLNIPDYVDPQKMDSVKGLPFTVDFISMCQKLVESNVIETKNHSTPFEVKMRWNLEQIAFDIKDFAYNKQLCFQLNKILFISDLHFGSNDIKDSKVHKELVSLLETIRPVCLVFLGDVIDLWAIAGFNDTKSQKVFESVNRLKIKFQEYSSLCKFILYLPGNHDFAVSQLDNPIRKLIQFEWNIENLLICEDICLLGKLPIPTFDNIPTGFSLTMHGHECSSVNKQDAGIGRCIANSYQYALHKPIIKNIRYIRNMFEYIPYLGDWEHRKLKKFGRSMPDVSVIAGHTHRPFLTVQKCEAKFGSIGSEFHPIDDWFKWYVNIGSWGYHRTYLLVENNHWRLKAFKKT